MRTPETDTKRAWRRAARAARDEIDCAAWSEALIDVLRAWPPLRAARVAAGFHALPDEPDLAPLYAGDARWVTPRIDDEGGPLRFCAMTAPTVRHRYGVREPAPDAPATPYAAIDVILVPALAFDRRGARLGRGAGHYDRTLPRLRPDALRVGVAHPARIVDRLPEDATDQRVDVLALPGGVERVGAARRSGLGQIELAP